MTGGHLPTTTAMILWYCAAAIAFTAIITIPNVRAYTVSSLSPYPLFPSHPYCWSFHRLLSY